MSEQQITKQNPENRDTFFVARVICEFPEGGRARLFATEFTQGGAFILAMKPPPFGALVRVTIYPLAQPQLPTLDARVIGVAIDPADASRSGFEIVFLHLDEIVQKKLSHAVSEIQQRSIHRVPHKLKTGAERRGYPRVPTDLTAHLELNEGESHTFKVENISMSGAKLVYSGKTNLPQLEPGTEIDLTLLCGSIPEYITLKARVARVASPEENPGVGIHFEEMDDTSERRIEGLILEALTGEKSWIDNA